MREIEFRGKDKSTGKWVYGDLTHTMGVTDTGLRPRIMVAGYEVFEDSGGQLVKNFHGKKFYEGDIAVTNDKDEPIHVILTWIKQNAMFAWLTVDEYIDYHHSGSIDIDNTMFWTYAFDDDSVKGIRVIGNVFDDKYLLK